MILDCYLSLIRLYTHLFMCMFKVMFKVFWFSRVKCQRMNEWLWQVILVQVRILLLSISHIADGGRGISSLVDGWTRLEWSGLVCE